MAKPKGGSSCVGPFRLEFIAHKGGSDFNTLFRCLQPGCGNRVQIPLARDTGYPTPPLGRMYWLRMKGDELEIMEAYT